MTDSHASADELDTRSVRAALAVLRASLSGNVYSGGSRAGDDLPFLLGRLLAAVELKAGAGGAHDEWASFDAGYLSAIAGSAKITKDDLTDAGVRVRLGVKRLARTVRQLQPVNGVAGQAARMALTAAVMALYAEAVLADDETSLAELTEPLEDAQRLLANAHGRITEARETLSEYGTES